MSRCRSCAAEIIWVSTPSGKAMPIDAEPSLRGNVELVGEGVNRMAVVHAQATMDFGGDRYMPHHATCPDADRWRRR